jgi:hypothetical protein
MDPLPLPQEDLTPFNYFGEQPSHIRPLDADARNDLRHPVSANQIYLRLSRSGYVHMRRLVIGCVDDEPVAIGAMDDDHRLQ